MKHCRPAVSCSRSGGRPGILLDRDGTIIVDRHYVGSIDDVELIEGSAEAIAAFNGAEIPVAVITNQAGVARGYYGVDDVEKVHHHIAERLADHGAHVDLFLFCPYHPEGTVAAFARQSPDRKPGPGMAIAAAEALNLDLASSWVVGDRPEDMGLAHAVGASGVFVGPGGYEDPDVWSFPDLASAAGFILDNISVTRAPVTLLTGRSCRPVATPKFPVNAYDRPAPYCHAYFNEWARAARSIDPAQLDRAAIVLLEAYITGATVFTCGNGGSAAIANHLQCDHLKGVRSGTDLSPRVVSLSSNIELMTAIANDIGYDDVFSYQLQSLARPGDVLFVISSSGRSPNIVQALRWAREHGMQTIALTGFKGGDARKLAAISIHVDSANYGVVEDTHQAVMHAFAQYIRQSRMRPDAIAAGTF